MFQGFCFIEQYRVCNHAELRLRATRRTGQAAGSSAQNSAAKQVWLAGRTHPEAPLVLDLPTEVEVDVGEQQAVPRPAQPPGPATVRCRHVARAVEVTKVLVGGLPVSRGKLPVNRRFSNAMPRAPPTWGSSRCPPG